MILIYITFKKITTAPFIWSSFHKYSTNCDFLPAPNKKETLEALNFQGFLWNHANFDRNEYPCLSQWTEPVKTDNRQNTPWCRIIEVHQGVSLCLKENIHTYPVSVLAKKCFVVYDKEHDTVSVNSLLANDRQHINASYVRSRCMELLDKYYYTAE